MRLTRENALELRFLSRGSLSVASPASWSYSDCVWRPLELIRHFFDPAISKRKWGDSYCQGMDRNMLIIHP